MGKFGFAVAFTLQWTIGIVWVLHQHIFCLLGLIVRDHCQCTNPYCGSILQQIGTLTTPIVIVYITNDVFNEFADIQSWQISHIIWGCCVAFLVCVRVVWVYWYGKNVRTFHDTLLNPFGIKSPKNSGKSWMYTIPLVALAPAIFVGFISNFVLEETYILKCDEIYNSISTICENGVCCNAISNHDDLVDFVPKVASSMLAGWGIVKSLGYFITVYGEKVSLDEARNIRSESAIRRSVIRRWNQTSLQMAPIATDKQVHYVSPTFETKLRQLRNMRLVCNVGLNLSILYASIRMLSWCCCCSQTV